MPGCIVSATTASFSSVEKRRLRATPVITSTFENVSDIGVCLGLSLGPPASAGGRSKRGALQTERCSAFIIDYTLDPFRADWLPPSVSASRGYPLFSRMGVGRELGLMTADDPLDNRSLARFAARRAGLVAQQAVHAFLHEPLLPAPHHRLAAAGASLDGVVAQPVRGQHNDARPPHMLLRAAITTGSLLSVAPSRRWRSQRWIWAFQRCRQAVELGQHNLAGPFADRAH